MKLVNLIILLVSILLPINADDVIRSGNTTEKDFLIEAILPKSSAAGGDRFSQLVVVDLIGGQNHAVVEDGEILSMGRGEPYRSSPVEAFRVMYTTNYPKDEVTINVQIGNFVLVQETSEGVYEEVVIDNETTELKPTVSCVRSSLFSNPEDESNEADVGSYKNVSSTEHPSYGAEGFKCKTFPIDNVTENTFSVKFKLQRYSNQQQANNGWNWVYNSSSGRYEWQFGGASYVEPSDDELLEGYFELDQTFSIRLPAVTTPGLYKTDVTVSVGAV